MTVAISVLALVASLSALAIALTSQMQRRREDDLEGQSALGGRVSELEVRAKEAFRHVAVVRYDAFGDTGGALSWSLALLDDTGAGFVVSSIHGRAESRTYAKSITAWSCEQPLTPEEQQAVDAARPA
ncbi:uncharacterized protein DUF4446 [Mumia flava]|uniref:Uncharacterized protein DUF4446 n=1 Tax=Mumia flava TaxID=1348852 RepID=A0A0B2BR04_9ACTN|nr:DUF4446 family protein [Mumia flava]PJJ57492.1 uncharacterized protein DUF4446 [Mumia flava]